MRGLDRVRTGLLLGALLFGGSAPALAQDMSEICDAIGGVKRGNWASFAMEGAQAAQVSAIRGALVDRGVASEPWFELKASTPQGDQIMQLRVPGFPFGGADVQSGIVKVGAMPAMQMPDQMLGMMRQQMASNPMLDVAAQCRASQLVGEETVDVPAGKMRAWHIKAAGGNDAWVSGQVPFGIVKFSGGNGAGTMVLTGFGADATSSIPEQPSAMPAMPGVPPQD